MHNSSDVVVAGHICLDIIPTFPAAAQTQEIVYNAGKLIDVGPAIMALGGSVANTGLALHRLGTSTRLMGKVGDDPLGQMILDILRRHDPALAADMLVEPGTHSSYSVVISPPGVDRTFFHHPGANDTFDASEIVPEQLHGSRLFHFGYPPLMRRLYSDGGRSFAAMLQRAKMQGMTVSLDMALPDPQAEAGRVDWQPWLAQVLPHVDIFMPSVDELEYMLTGAISRAGINTEKLSAMAQRCLQWGAAMVVLKLGSEGLYVRTTTELVRLQQGGLAFSRAQMWVGRELFAPCFQVDVVGTTGSGDCTIAGFLMAMLQNQAPEETVTSAVAVGAYSVEQADATSGLADWTTVQKRIERGWGQRTTQFPLAGWQQHGNVWRGPADQKQID
jgi:sugar/nucleoside kinase (ribokinase family)